MKYTNPVKWMFAMLLFVFSLSFIGPIASQHPELTIIVMLASANFVLSFL